MRWYFIAAPILAAVIFLIILWICIRTMCKKRQVLNRSHPHTVYVVPERQSRTVAETKDFLERRPVYGNQGSQEYLVPYSALPVNFDFSARDIKVFGDYVILKDLSILEHQSTVNEPSSPGAAYEKQSPYNPDFIQQRF